MDLNDMRRLRKDAAALMGTQSQALTDLENADTPDGEAIQAAQASFDAAKADFDKLAAQIVRAEASEAAVIAAAVSETSAPAGGPVPASAQNPEEKGVDAGLMIGALLKSKGDRDKAVARLETDGHSGLSASLATTSEGAGGVTIPRPLAATLIGLLKAKVVVRRAGAKIHDMPAGALRNAKMATGPTAGYGAELAPIAVSQPSMTAVDEKFKVLTSLVPVSLQLLRYSSTSMGALIRDTMLDAMALREDLAFIRSPGSALEPTGLRYFALAENWLDPISNGATAVRAGLRAMKSKIENADVPMTSAGWVMRAGVKNFLAELRDPVGGLLLYPSIDTNNTLHGWPIYDTSQIPDNLGVGGDESEVYLVDFAQMAIGDAADIMVDTSTEAAYEEGGVTKSAFQRNQTLFKAVSEHDFASLHDEAIAGGNVIGWE